MREPLLPGWWVWALGKLKFEFHPSSRAGALMHIVIAPDKFKGSLTAPEAASAIQRGVRLACPEATIDLAPMADGGEGTVDALVIATGGSYQSVRVRGPLGGPVEAQFGLLGDGRTAVMEMASASGLALLPAGERDPFQTTTRGTGELLRAILDLGVRHGVVGIGGSATNEGGAGFAQALGYRLLDAGGAELLPGGGALDQLVEIDASQCDARLGALTIDVACDVDNPLCGTRGATAVFGPQKFALGRLPTAEDLAKLDANLGHLARIIERDLGPKVAELPGAGAAGGLGAGLVAFAGGRLRPGIEIVIEAVGLQNRLRGADLCITGEGALDGSSAGGKTPVGVARHCRLAGVPCLALAGKIGDGAAALEGQGIDAYFSICPGPISLDAAIDQAGPLLSATAEQAVRLFMAARRQS